MTQSVSDVNKELSAARSKIEASEELISELQAATTFTPTPAKNEVVALVFFGFFPRDFGTGSCPDDFTSVEQLALPNLRQQVVEPSLADGYNVTVVGHTWSNSKCSEERKTHRYNAADVRAAVERAFPHPRVHVGEFAWEDEAIPGCRNALGCWPNVIGPLLSMGRALRLLPNTTLVSYQVLLLRWDINFFTPFSFAQLDPGIFYRANWCRATGPVVHAPSGQTCHELAPFMNCGCVNQPVCLPPKCAQNHCVAGPSDGYGLPDFWFAGRHSALQAVFGGAAENYTAGRVGTAGCCCMHGVTQWLVEEHARAHGLQLGRYKHHQVDYDHLRTGHGTPERTAFVRGGGALFLEVDARGEGVPAYNVSRAQNHSVCRGLHYCEWDGATNGHPEFSPRRRT